MKKQITQFKKDLSHPLTVMCLAIITSCTLSAIVMNIDKINYFFGTAYYYIGITLGLIETF